MTSPFLFLGLPSAFISWLFWGAFSASREHEELLSAFSRGDSVWAAALMTGHIRRAFHAFSGARPQSSDNDAK